MFTNNLIFQMDKAIYMKIFKSIKTCKEDSTTDKLDARQRMDKMLLLQQHAFTSQGYFMRKKVNAKGKPQMAQKTKRDVHSLHPVGPGVGTWHCEAE